jgi:hypothetical protein
MATLSHSVTGGRIMFPSPRARTPQSDTTIPSPQHGHTTTTTASSSRSSGFSRFLKRASPGSTAGSQSRTDGKDLSVSMHEDGGKPVRRRAFEEERFDRDIGRSSPDEAGRSDVSSFNCSFSARCLSRTSAISREYVNHSLRATWILHRHPVGLLHELVLLHNHSRPTIDQAPDRRSTSTWQHQVHRIGTALLLLLLLPLRTRHTPLPPPHSLADRRADRVFTLHHHHHHQQQQHPRLPSRTRQTNYNAPKVVNLRLPRCLHRRPRCLMIQETRDHVHALLPLDLEISTALSLRMRRRRGTDRSRLSRMTKRRRMTNNQRLREAN